MIRSTSPVSIWSTGRWIRLSAWLRTLLRQISAERPPFFHDAERPQLHHSKPYNRRSKGNNCVLKKLQCWLQCHYCRTAAAARRSLTATSGACGERASSPQPIRLSANAVGWPARVIDEWLAERPKA